MSQSSWNQSKHPCCPS